MHKLKSCLLNQLDSGIKVLNLPHLKCLTIFPRNDAFKMFFYILFWPLNFASKLYLRHCHKRNIIKIDEVVG